MFCPVVGVTTVCLGNFITQYAVIIAVTIWYTGYKAGAAFLETPHFSLRIHGRVRQSISPG